MDLKIAGRSAVLMASSRGLGRACAESLAGEGVKVVINGRSAADVDTAVHELREANAVEVVGVVGDATEAETHDALLAACPEPDIVLLNADGPAPTDFDAIDETAWAEAMQRSMIAPLQFVQRVLPGMQDRSFGRLVTVSSAMVKSPHPMMSLSHGPRLGLIGVLKGISKSAIKHNVTMNSLLPERFDTGRQEFMAHQFMERFGMTYDEARKDQVKSIKAGRLGLPSEFGDACAFLCSAQASYISGQTIQLDGGSYEGVF